MSRVDFTGTEYLILLFDFNGVIDFNINSWTSFYSNTSLNNGARRGDFVFKDTNNVCQLWLSHSSPGANLQTYINTNLCLKDPPRYDTDYNSNTKINNTVLEFRHNMSENNITFLNQTNIKYVYFIISSDSNSDSSTYLDLLSFNNILFGNNELPNVNLTLKQPYCLNESRGFADIEYNISSYDPENNVIYYYSSINEKNETNYLDFWKKSTTLLGNYRITATDDWYKYRIDIVNNCWINPISPFNYYNQSMINQISYIYPDKDFYKQKEIIGLELNGFCTGSTKGIYINSPKLYKSFYLKTTLIDIEDESLNFTIYNTYFNLSLDLKIQQYHNRVEIFDNNIIKLNISTSSLVDNNIIPFILNIRPTNYTFTILTNTSNYEYTTSVALNHTKFFSFNPIGYSKILIDNIEYGGLSSTPSFTITPNLKYTAYGKGNYEFTLLYTDDHHLNEFKTLTTNLFLDECKYQYDAPTQIQNIFDLIQDGTGRSITDFLRSTGTYNLAKASLYLFFFVSLLISSITFYLKFSNINFKLILMGNALLFYTLSYILSFTEHQITFGIVFILPFASLIIPILVGSNE